ncbi:Uncharacterized protein C18orf63 [Habropoda laboriosa]|uniref:Uncharacterized protein C18orf63 n=1 Tax=Habropoda laboriosa TaxID=597456 RepID=A0A0L7REE9_9HYME|nr:Uncharacterized protein C18orf63 [Habropoda laboriosa]
MDTSNLIYERKEQIVVYASFPQMSELCCVICETDFIEVHDSSSKSNFHWQTIKCRLLIHLIPDVIAMPVSGTERFIFVVANKRYFETGKLERILRNFKLVYRGLRSITNELYKICLMYTIQTKIAPLWNKVGDYFVQGKEFYNFIEGIRSVKLDILIYGNDICLQFCAIKVKIPYIKLEDYLPPSVISQFLADPKGYINLSCYKFPFIHVLPSTKKGKLLSVSKEIPAKSVFKNYDQLRRHWKNMYGYSLPKHENHTLYYEIKFLIPRSKIFTYPNLCVASGPLDIIPSGDKEHTITYFLSDLLLKLPTICGKELQISKHAPFNSVKAMARNNQLDQVKSSVLSDWLKRHSIPHNSKTKKAELINKVLSHIKNTINKIKMYNLI